MLTRTFYAGAAAVALAAGPAAIANDSGAEMTAAGGLVLKSNRNIDLLNEDLYVSAEQIRVNYVFRNQGRQDESVIVAFPITTATLDSSPP